MKHRLLRAVALMLMSTFLFSLVLASSGSGKIKLTFWHLFKADPSGKEPRAYALWKSLDLFERIYPDIKVQQEQVPWGQIERRLIPMAAVGETPDVVHIFSIFLAQHVEAGTIAPLDEYVKNWDPSDWFLGWDPATIDGKIWGVPEEYRAVVLEYRADYLEEAGLDVPKTWHDVGIAAAKLTTETRRGFSIGASLKDFGDNLNELLAPVIWDAGGEVFDEDFRLKYNNEAGLKVFKMLYDLMYKYHAIDETVIDDDYNTIHQALRAGTLAMGTLGFHRVGTIRKQGNFGENFQFTPLPSFQDGGLYGSGKPAPAFIFNWFFSIGKYAKHPEAGMLLIQWMNDRVVKTEYAKAGLLPPRYSVYEDPWFRGDAIQVRDLVRLKDYIRDYGKPLIWPPWTTDYWKIVATETQKMWLKKQSPEETLNIIEKRYNEEVLR